MAGGNGTNAKTELNTLTTNQLQELALVVNAMYNRVALANALGQMAYGGARDYNVVLGYPVSLETAHYQSKYDRQDIAGRVVDLPATDTWRKHPVVSEDGDTETEFAQAWKNLEKQHSVCSRLMRADRISGIGRFGVLFIGYADGEDAQQPVQVTGLNGPDSILFLRPFSESNVSIKTFDTDTSSKRFGLPALYSLRVESGGGGTTYKEVHWSRILHLADNKADSDVYGIPRLQRVYNRLDDLMKLVGGSAEATWLNMRGGGLLTTQSDYEIDETDSSLVTDLDNQIEEWAHGLLRFIRAQGMDFKNITGQVVDPKGPFEVVIALIAAASGIPQRVLLGSAAGELAAAEEDTKQWFGEVESRQINYAEPEILRPFIDMQIGYGILPEPVNGYDVTWPPLFQLSESDIAQIRLTNAQAVKALSNPLTMQLPIDQEQVLSLLGFASELESGIAGNLRVARTVIANARVGNISPAQYRDWLAAELAGIHD